MPDTEGMAHIYISIYRNIFIYIYICALYVIVCSTSSKSQRGLLGNIYIYIVTVQKNYTYIFISV